MVRQADAASALPVVLTGGCFQNRHLLERTVQRLRSDFYEKRKGVLRKIEEHFLHYTASETEGLDQKTMAEMEAMHSLYGTTFFPFWDDALTANMQRLVEMLEAFERNLSFSPGWFAITRANTSACASANSK
mgnify:CR=1 FL=1